MIRQPEIEREARLSLKTLEQAALTQLVNDFNYKGNRSDGKETSQSIAGNKEGG
jgi:hypothetical protein